LSIKDIAHITSFFFILYSSCHPEHIVQLHRYNIGCDEFLFICGNCSAKHLIAYCSERTKAQDTSGNYTLWPHQRIVFKVSVRRPITIRFSCKCWLLCEIHRH
jgi:hypothetical protein